MKALETRTKAGGFTTRRYERADGTRLTTYEVPASVLKAIGMKRFRAEMATYQRGVERRGKADRVRRVVAASPHSSTELLAKALDVTVQRIRQVRKQLKEQNA